MHVQVHQHVYRDMSVVLGVLAERLMHVPDALSSTTVECLLTKGTR